MICTKKQRYAQKSNTIYECSQSALCFLNMSIIPSHIYLTVHHVPQVDELPQSHCSDNYMYIQQDCHQPGTPGKVRELKICLKNQGKVKEFIKKMVTSGKWQGI